MKKYRVLKSLFIVFQIPTLKIEVNTLLVLIHLVTNSEHLISSNLI